MSQPTPYYPQYNFTQYQQSHPATPLPAASVDSELFNVAVSVTEICNNLALIQRDDGAVANATIGYDQLKGEVVVGLNQPLPWVTNKAYTVGTNVYFSNNIYTCAHSHTSTVFATDLASGFWALFIDFSTPLTAAAASATAAAASATSASASATAAAASATAASSYAASYTATSTTSLAIGTSAKTFATQSGKLFATGQQLLISSNANSANYMHGSVTSYSGTSLVMNITDVGGSGTLADWNIALSGTQGPVGATGPAGSGSGNMLSTNNLSDVASATTSRTNLSAAKSANNSDITSLSGLTTPLSIAQGGIGANTAAGGRTALGLGTAATVDTGTGASNVPTITQADARYAAAGIATGSLVLLSTKTASNSPTINFTSSISSTYDDYVILYEGVQIPNGYSSGVYYGLSVDNGVNWLLSSLYNTTTIAANGTNTSNHGSGSGGAPIQSTMAGASNVFAYGKIELFNMNSSWTVKPGLVNGAIMNGATSLVPTFGSTGVVTSAAAANAVQILPDGGAPYFTVGTFRLYGIKKS